MLVEVLVVAGDVAPAEGAGYLDLLGHQAGHVVLGLVLVCGSN